jgi:hypothetical protein
VAKAEQRRASQLAQKTAEVTNVQTRQSQIYLHGRFLSDGTDYNPATNFGNYPDYTSNTDEDRHLSEAKQNGHQNTIYNRNIDGKVVDETRNSNPECLLQRDSPHPPTSDHSDETHTGSRFDHIKLNYKKLFKVSFSDPKDYMLYETNEETKKGERSDEVVLDGEAKDGARGLVNDVSPENEDECKARVTTEPPRRGVKFASVHLEATRSFQPVEMPTEPRSILKKKRQTLKLRFPKPNTEQVSRHRGEPGSHIRNFFRNTEAGISFRQRTAGLSFRRTQGDESSPPQRTPRIPSLEATRARNRSMAANMAPPPANRSGLSPFLSSSSDNDRNRSSSPPASPNAADNPTFSGDALQELLRSFGGVAGVNDEAKRRRKQRLQKKSRLTPGQNLPVSPQTGPETFDDHDYSSIPQIGVDMGVGVALGLSEEEVRLQQRELLKFQQKKAHKQAVSPRGRSTLPQLRGSQVVGAWQTNTHGRQAYGFCSEELALTAQPNQTMAIPHTYPSPRAQRYVTPNSEMEIRRPISPAFPLSLSLSKTSTVSSPASPTMPAPGTLEFLKYMQDAAKRKETEGEPMITGSLMREAFRRTTNFDKLAAREEAIRADGVKRKRKEDPTDDSVPLKLTNEERERRTKRRDEKKRERERVLTELKKEPIVASSTNLAPQTSFSSTSTNLRSLIIQNTTGSFSATPSLTRPIIETNAGTIPSGELDEVINSGAEKFDTDSGDSDSETSGFGESEDLSDLSEGWSERDSVDSNEEEKETSPTQLPSRRQIASVPIDSSGFPRYINGRDQDLKLRMSKQRRPSSEVSETDEDREWIIRCRANSRRRREKQAWDNDVARVLEQNGRRANREYQRQRRLEIGSVNESDKRTERVDPATSILGQEEVERTSKVDSAVEANKRAEARPSVESFVSTLEPLPELEQIGLSRPPIGRVSISPPPLLTLATLTKRSPPPPDNFEEGARGRRMEGFSDAELEDVLATGEPAVTILGPMHSVRMEDIVPMGYGQKGPSARPLSPPSHPRLDDNTRGRDRTPTKPLYTDPRMREELEVRETEMERDTRERAINLLSSNSLPPIVESNGNGESTRKRVFRINEGSARITGTEDPRRPTPEPFTPEPQPELRRPDVEEHSSEREPEPMVMDDIVHEHIDPTVTDLEEVIDEDLVDNGREGFRRPETEPITPKRVVGRGAKREAER